MVVKYSKLFTVTDPFTEERFTILVQLVDIGDYKHISTESLEGEYHSTDEFEKTAQNNSNQVYQTIPLKIVDTPMLMDALKEAYEASKEA